MIKDILLNGIADSDIRQEALSTEGMLVKSNQIVVFVESRETARDANNLSICQPSHPTDETPSRLLTLNDRTHRLQPTRA